MRILTFLALSLVGCDAQTTAISGPDGSQPDVRPAPQTATILTTNAVENRTIFVQIDNAGANDTAYTVYGNTGGQTCPPPLGGECFDVSGAAVFGITGTNGTGDGSIINVVPTGIPVGTLTNVQALGLGGGSAWATNVRPLAMDGSTVCAANTSSAANPSFELGLYGVWNYNGSPLLSTDAIEGSTSFEHTGNFFIEQTFPDVPVPALTQASFWSWHDMADFPAMYVEWSYSDGTIGSSFYSGTSLDGWQEHDLAPLLDATKELSRVLAYGYSGGGPAPDITRFDAFAFCR